MEVVAYVHDHLTLLLGEAELGVDIAVDAFARLAPDGDDGGIAVFRLFHGTAGAHLHLRHFLLAELGTLEPLRRVTVGFIFQQRELHVFPVNLSQLLCRLDAGILQPFHQVDHIGRVDTARAGATRQELVGTDAEERHGVNLLAEWQSPVVFQQHDAFVGHTTRDFGMSLEVGLVGGRILLEGGCLHDILQHTTHVAVHIGHVELSAFHASDDFLHLLGLSRLHEVVAGLHFRDGGQALADADPVGHHDALEAPVVAQDFRQQVVAPLCKLTVDDVVGRHHGPGLALTYGNLEPFQVELACGSLRHALVHARTFRLLRVDGEVLDACACPLGLHAVDVGGGNLAGHQRVFGVILEVPSTQGVAVEVHARTENHVAVVFLHFLSDGPSDFLCQRGVPGAGDGGADGEAGSVVGVRVPFACGVDANAGRTVGQDRARDAQTGDGGGGAGGSRNGLCRTAHHGVVAEEVVLTAHEQRGFLLEGHGLHHLVDVVGPQLRRVLR